MTTTIPNPQVSTAPVELSRHATSEGTVMWFRCGCGRLRMVSTPDSPTARPMAAGGRTPGCPECG
ncbi:hypothetical protein [Streptomyces millisiae]|uniref:Uncharacterized protein n=1 Tax=Streptomyces millisiae TaxID=3075542 RepID=A0ABU2LH77_9ACTN|nr:hypothetical protein [Streptomyces sp. DSM 44918]MDT0316944.1 hypothetical protein [Streptomyces sp. DSM 44918]